MNGSVFAKPWTRGSPPSATARISALTLDVSEYLATLELPPGVAPARLTVAYHGLNLGRLSLCASASARATSAFDLPSNLTAATTTASATTRATRRRSPLSEHALLALLDAAIVVGVT